MDKLGELPNWVDDWLRAGAPNEAPTSAQPSHDLHRLLLLETSRERKNARRLVLGSTMGELGASGSATLALTQPYTNLCHWRKVVMHGRD